MLELRRQRPSAVQTKVMSKYVFTAKIMILNDIVGFWSLIEDYFLNNEKSACESMHVFLCSH